MNIRRILALLILVPFVAAANWPQYRGPNRNDVSTETGLLTSWPDGGPKLLWTFDQAGVGYSGPAIVGDRLYTIGGRGDDEFLIAIDTTSGKELWATKVGPLFTFKGNNWSAGPSATPTVDGDAVFALGGTGMLLCADAASGKARWSKNLPEELEAQVNPIGGGPKNLGWGYTWSALVDGDKLICVPGGPKGTVAALDKKTGKVLWRSTAVTDQAAYTSPMLLEDGKNKQYVVLTNQGLLGVGAADGKLLWKHAHRYGTEVINSPLVSGTKVYATVGAGAGCDLIELERDGAAYKAKQIYTNKNMVNHHGNVVLVDQHVYGYSQGKGWICQKLDTGDIVWSERKALRAGALTCADGRLYCYGEDDGTTVLIEATTTGWKESGRFKIPKQSPLRKPRGKIWTPPVVANGKLYLRDQELLFCYDVKK
ncbi:MAG: PQQ-binding-like beta-propeller repeat protein [Gemmataceae bacterium]